MSATLIADACVHRDWIVAAYVEGAESSDKFAVASRRGGRCGLAESLDELAELPEEWGYDGKAIREAVASYNETIEAGAEPTPVRRFDRHPLDEPPYYVMEAIPAITFPFYGIRIDSRARVLDTHGQPIPGLLAAGSDTGGVFVRAYAGGIANALVFELTAARTPHLAVRRRCRTGRCEPASERPQPAFSRHRRRRHARPVQMASGEGSCRPAESPTPGRGLAILRCSVSATGLGCWNTSLQLDDSAPRQVDR